MLIAQTLELLPGAPAIAQGGLVGVLLTLVSAFVFAILKGKLEPRSTSERIERALEKRYEALREAYTQSEEARRESVEVARESLEASKASLKVLEELRRKAGNGS